MVSNVTNQKKEGKKEVAFKLQVSWLTRYLTAVICRLDKRSGLYNFWVHQTDFRSGWLWSSWCNDKIVFAWWTCKINVETYSRLFLAFDATIQILEWNSWSETKRIKDLKIKLPLLWALLWKLCRTITSSRKFNAYKACKDEWKKSICIHIKHLSFCFVSLHIFDIGFLSKWRSGEILSKHSDAIKPWLIAVRSDWSHCLAFQIANIENHFIIYTSLPNQWNASFRGTAFLRSFHWLRHVTRELMNLVFLLLIKKTHFLALSWKDLWIMRLWVIFFFSIQMAEIKMNTKETFALNLA